MREDPLISGGIVKFLLVVLVLAAGGFGGYQLLKDIDLPDLESAGITNLEETTLEDTTIGVPEPVPQVNTPVGTSEQPIDTFTSRGFGAALAAVRGAAGARAQLTQIVINEVQVQFVVRAHGDSILSYSYLASSGGLQRQDATISISGNATLDDFAFPLAIIRPGWVDRLVRGARKLSGKADYRPSVYTLERALPFGRRNLEWTLNGQGGGRYLLYRSAADARGFTNPGGEGTVVPQAALDAQKLQDCIADADGDPYRILDCVEKN